MRSSWAWASLPGRVAGVATIAALQTYWFLQPAPLTFKALVGLLAVVAIARPAAGLIAFAGLAPVSTAIASFCGAGGMGAQLLEQLALGVAVGVILRSGKPEERTRIGAPALLFATVAMASAAAIVLAAAMTQSSPVWAPVFAAVTVAECGLLAWSVERTVRRSPRMAAWLIAVALVGHAWAALLVVNAVVGAAIRTGSFLGELPRLLITTRLSMQTDVHAAASALLPAGVAGFGLMSGPRARRASVGLVLAIVGVGLWATGSRVAIVLAIVATVVAIGWSAAHGRRRRAFVAVAAMLVIVAGVWLTQLPSSRYSTTSHSVSSRIVMLKAGLQMFETAPLFGIGITNFYATSAAVVGPDLQTLVGYPRENAHNNFLQVLAEEGLIGLGAMLWWLAVVLVSGFRAQISNPDSLRRALLAAIAACIGTWATGHPLLVPEFAFVFWFYCGILTAMTPAPPTNRPRWVLAVLVAAVLVSVVPRANALRNDFDLEHLGFGVSTLWQHDDEQRYREAGASFALYLQATGRPVEVPIRRAPGAPDPLVIDVRIGNKLVDSISVEGDRWQTAMIQIPAGSRRFELVEFAVRPPPSGSYPPGVLLRVGRDAAR